MNTDFTRDKPPVNSNVTNVCEANPVMLGRLINVDGQADEEIVLVKHWWEIWMLQIYDSDRFSVKQSFTVMLFLN